MLELKNICLTYSYKKVLCGVNASFEEGKIYSLLGENGAGKSTLAHIICGDLRADSGSLILNGQKLNFDSAGQALKKGIGCVHQRPLLATSISVWENLQLGNNHLKKKDAETLLKNLIPGVKMKTLVKNLNPSQKFFVSLAGILLKNPEILILDEPTALLEPKQADFLFEILRQKTAVGMTILVITHNLNEAICKTDGIVILRDGNVIASGNSRDFTESKIRALMFDQADANTAPAVNTELSGAHTALAVNTELSGTDTAPAVNTELSGTDAASTVNTEVPDALTTPAVNTEVPGPHTTPAVNTEVPPPLIQKLYTTESEDSLTGMDSDKIRELRKEGTAIIPSDRTFRASNPDLTILQLTTTYKTELSKKEFTEYARKITQKAGVNIHLDEKVNCLSGGMLQRLILQRELDLNPKKIIFCSPYQGLDSDAVCKLNKIIAGQIKKGTKIILAGELS
jgi:ABC-type uncharacterized transport system ATPase subunit